MVSTYQQFVKDHIGQFSHLPAKERMKAVAQLYKKGSEAPVPAKKGRGRPKKEKGGLMTAGALDESGGSFLDFAKDLMHGDVLKSLSEVGSGLPAKKGRGRPKKEKGGLMTAGAFTAGDLPKAPITTPLQSGGNLSDMFLKGILQMI